MAEAETRYARLPSWIYRGSKLTNMEQAKTTVLQLYRRHDVVDNDEHFSKLHTCEQCYLVVFEHTTS